MNIIKGLIGGCGQIVSDRDELFDIVNDYFMQLFTSQGCRNSDHILEGVEPCITGEMNNNLNATYEREEILTALKAMTPTKASRSDGLLVLFYQNYWHIVGQNVGDYCLEVLNGGKSLAYINKTNIVFIPKNGNPTCMQQFRPISLCFVLYKIISKTVVNRFQKVLNLCVDES